MRTAAHRGGEGDLHLVVGDLRREPVTVTFEVVLHDGSSVK